MRSGWEPEGCGFDHRHWLQISFDPRLPQQQNSQPWCYFNERKFHMGYFKKIAKGKIKPVNICNS